MRQVYLLTLRQLSGRWRIAIMAVLATLPAIIALALISESSTDTVEEFELAVLSTMLAGSIVPLVVLAIGAAAFGNEVEDQTLANLTLTPAPRWKIALPKLLATITVAAPFVALSAFATGHIAFLGEWNATIAITVSALAAVAMYSSLFVWLGLVSAQAIGIGLLYIVLWEGFLSGFIAGVRLLSIRYYSLAIMHGLDERRFADMQLGASAAIVLAAVVIVGFLLLTIRKLRRMDVP